MYKVIFLETSQIVFFSNNYYDCIDWIENYGDILNYTIIE